MRLFEHLEYLLTDEALWNAHFGHSPDSATSADHEKVEKAGVSRKATITVQYLEIYNESVNDLLRENNRNLDIRETKDGKIFV